MGRVHKALILSLVQDFNKETTVYILQLLGSVSTLVVNYNMYFNEQCVVN